MKNLMETNCYDIDEKMIIVGTCLKQMQPQAYDELSKSSENIYELCLENTHLNMAITKIIGMLSRVKVKKLIFASVDKSPHCIQLHYIENEIQKAMKLEDIEIKHYVGVDNKLIEISKDTIKKSKSLAELQSNT